MASWRALGAALLGAQAGLPVPRRGCQAKAWRYVGETLRRRAVKTMRARNLLVHALGRIRERYKFLLVGYAV
jgi:hypothetical protein